MVALGSYPWVLAKITIIAKKRKFAFLIASDLQKHS